MFFSVINKGKSNHEPDLQEEIFKPYSMSFHVC